MGKFTREDYFINNERGSALSKTSDYSLTADNILKDGYSFVKLSNCRLTLPAASEALKGITIYVAASILSNIRSAAGFGGGGDPYDVVVLGNYEMAQFWCDGTYWYAFYVSPRDEPSSSSSSSSSTSSSSSSSSSVSSSSSSVSSSSSSSSSKSSSSSSSSSSSVSSSSSSSSISSSSSSSSSVSSSSSSISSSSSSSSSVSSSSSSISISSSSSSSSISSSSSSSSSTGF
jgi:hypothetical protein